MILNEKVINYKVVVLIEIYNLVLVDFPSEIICKNFEF
jgi:hypothetical protein